MSCGGEHSVVLTNEGDVLAFGGGDAGQLGRKSSDYASVLDAFKPVCVMGLSKMRVVQVRTPVLQYKDVLLMHYLQTPTCAVHVNAHCTEFECLRKSQAVVVHICMDIPVSVYVFV